MTRRMLPVSGGGSARYLTVKLKCHLSQSLHKKIGNLWSANAVWLVKTITKEGQQLKTKTAANNIYERLTALSS